MSIGRATGGALAGLAVAVLVVSALLGGPGGLVAPAGPDNPCLKPGNLVQNCDFARFVVRDVGGREIVVPEGWSPFILAGTPDFRPAEDTCPDDGPGCGYPSLWLISEGLPFTAGVYQQVAVTPGVVYQADIGWAAASTADFERKLGLDPTGGTDPRAPTVVWGPSEWGVGGQHNNPNLTVSAPATGPAMTLFIWVGHRVSHGSDSIYLDAPALWPDPSQPTATATSTDQARLATATPTRRPKAAAPTKQPTSTPTETPSPTPTPTPTAAPTDTATARPTATPTATASPVPPTATATPTATRTPVPVAVARVAPAAAARPAARAQPVGKGRSPEGLLYAAGGSLSGALLLAGGGAAVWLRRRRRRS